MPMRRVSQNDTSASVTERCDSRRKSIARECSGVLVMLHATPVVFVVDDDMSVRKSLESLIDSAGWRSETFPSAEEFLHRPRVLAPSCLVLDVSLPDLDGLELQRRLAPHRTDMPIIFI